MTASIREALARIGGPCSVTWLAFWGTLVANLLHHLGGAPDLPQDKGLRLIAVLVSQAAMFAVLLLAKATVLRGTAVRPRPWATMATFAVAGLMRGIALLAVWGQRVDLQTPQTVQRLITGMVSFTVYLAVSAYLVALYRQNKSLVERSEQTQATLAVTQMRAQEELAMQGREGVERVRAEIAVQVDARQSGDLRPEHLDAFLDGALRPMIRELVAGIRPWEPPAPAAVDPRLTSRRVYSAVAVGRPFAPGVQGLLSMASTVGILAVLPAWQSLPAVLTSVVGPWILFAMGNRLLGGLTPQTPTRVRATAVAVWLLVCAAVLGVVYGLLMWGTPYVKSGVMSGVFVTVLLGATTVIARATLTAQRIAESELAASTAQLRWEIARLGQLQWHQQQQLARALHGPVQTAVIQAAMRPDEADAVRDRVFLALQESLRDDARFTTVSDVLAAVTKSWAQICEVTGRVEPAAEAADDDRLAVACLAEFVQEAVSNAVRHGGARAVAITVAAQADALRVSVLDNGTRSALGSGTGLGSRMMDDCALAWSRERTENGTRLWFVLPALMHAGEGQLAPAG